MAFLGLGAGAAAGGTAGAGMAGSTAAGLGTAGGLGLGGAAATPALSLGGTGAALGSTIPAIGASTPALAGGISTAGGVAPQLMSQGGPGFWDSVMGGLGSTYDSAGKILDSPIGKTAQGQMKKEKEQVPQGPAMGAMAPRSGTGGEQASMTPEDQMNALLGRLFGAQGA